MGGKLTISLMLSCILPVREDIIVEKTTCNESFPSGKQLSLFYGAQILLKPSRFRANLEGLIKHNRWNNNIAE